MLSCKVGKNYPELPQSRKIDKRENFNTKMKYKMLSKTNKKAKKFNGARNYGYKWMVKNCMFFFQTL
jgi:hypothetical protein